MKGERRNNRVQSNYPIKYIFLCLNMNNGTKVNPYFKHKKMYFIG